MSEFHRLDVNTGWSTSEGYPAGIKRKILASDLDERGKMGRPINFRDTT